MSGSGGSSFPVQTTTSKFSKSDATKNEKSNVKIGSKILNDTLEISNKANIITNRVKDDFLLDESISKNYVTKIFNMAKKVINKSNLKTFFTKEYRITCEKEIFNENKEILIPDRIMFDKNQTATIMDYKTGEPRKSDLNQVEKYKLTLQKMGIDVDKALLVYVGSSIEVISV